MAVVARWRDRSGRCGAVGRWPRAGPAQKGWHAGLCLGLRARHARPACLVERGRTRSHPQRLRRAGRAGQPERDQANAREQGHGLGRRQDLLVHAAPRREVPQRRRADLSRRPGIVRALPARQPECQQPVRGRTLRHARPADLHHPAQGAQRRAARRAEVANLPADDPARCAKGQTRARHRRGRYRALLAGRMGQGQPPGDQALRRLCRRHQRRRTRRLRRAQDRAPGRGAIPLHARSDNANRRAADR